MQGNLITLFICSMWLFMSWFEPLDAQRWPYSGSRRDKCNLPLEIGLCKAAFERYYYDRVTRRCQAFIYGGCQGNANNFLTKSRCIRECGRLGSCQDKCNLPLEIGLCEAVFPHYYYDTVTRQCQAFMYGGCRGNANNFLTKSECIRECGRLGSCQDKCNLPLEIGRCKAAFERYYYDTVTRRCEPFIYGGCGGNANNFLTNSECIRECGQLVTFPYECTLPKVVGRCKASFKRYYYNMDRRKCELFIYGGCRGNENNFVTEEECIQQCALHLKKSYYNISEYLPFFLSSVKVPYECTLPKVVGRCKASFKRYYYNMDSGKCELFIYGGCQGNENNFYTEEECIQQCGS
ncbi:hypothetical protein JRQ81_010855 [Phrynocephalus forsythii]|uniref:BPTI/Kunitz inhibitor domain-containing protein n=1 Tax=Phrynocephalus forsythii TaxID=171643 RepID=A0A9Q1AR66_9SAUR|nr:hypothetical protein JRQ81_010855 [Phrynocephalus forsythii]